MSLSSITGFGAISLSKGTYALSVPGTAVISYDDSGNIVISKEGSASISIAQTSDILTADPRRAKYGNRARFLTGITDETLTNPYWRDYGSSNEYAFAPISSGTATANVGGPGVVRVAGNSTSGGGSLNWPGFSGNNQSYSTSTMVGKRWYLVFCWKIQSVAPNTDSRFYGMFGTGTMAGSVAVGFNGRVQTAKYAFSAMAADAATTAPALNVLSTVSPVVGRVDVGELAYDGRKVYGSINGEPLVTVANANVLSGSATISPQWETRPAGNGQTDVFDIDFDGMWVEQ